MAADSTKPASLAPVAELVTGKAWIFFAELAKNDEERKNNRRNGEKE
jgi:hypothetical protein